MMNLSKTQALFDFDQTCLSDWHPCGIRYLIGVDEVGRGSLIGPVVAAAVLFPLPWTGLPEILAGLNDSKQLKPAQRQQLEPLIQQTALWSVTQATQSEVETLNVAQASLLAATRAVDDLLQHNPQISPNETGLLLDGRALPRTWTVGVARAIVRGDGLSAHIAAASILAKEWRDRWVIEQHAQYPHYGWAQNMGYATPAHRAGLAHHGRSPLHRSTFQANAHRV